MSVCGRLFISELLNKEITSKSTMAQYCPHSKNLRGLWGLLPCWIFTRAPRIFAMFLHWQHKLLLICTHATLFRHRAHIRLWLHSHNKWAPLRRHKLTGGGCGENGLHGDEEQTFHTCLEFSQDQFSSNQLLWCGVSASLSIWQVKNCLICLTWLRDTLIMGVMKITRWPVLVMCKEVRLKSPVITWGWNEMNSFSGWKAQ